MSKPKDEKSPYGDFTVEEIELAETGAYVIQLGGEFFDYYGKFSFDKKTADSFYKTLYDGLYELTQTSTTEEEKLDAIRSILLLKIHPLRFH